VNERKAEDEEDKYDADEDEICHDHLFS